MAYWVPVLPPRSEFALTLPFDSLLLNCFVCELQA